MTYDTPAEGLVRSDNDQAYIEEIEELWVWMEKTKKKKKQSTHSLRFIKSMPADVVKSAKIPGGPYHKQSKNEPETKS